MLVNTGRLFYTVCWSFQGFTLSSLLPVTANNVTVICIHTSCKMDNYRPTMPDHGHITEHRIIISCWLRNTTWQFLKTLQVLHYFKQWFSLAKGVKKHQDLNTTSCSSSIVFNSLVCLHTLILIQPLIHSFIHFYTQSMCFCIWYAASTNLYSSTHEQCQPKEMITLWWMDLLALPHRLHVNLSASSFVTSLHLPILNQETFTCKTIAYWKSME